METIADLLDLDTSGEEPLLDILSELEGNRPVPNTRPCGTPFQIIDSHGEGYYLLPEPPDWY